MDETYGTYVDDACSDVYDYDYDDDDDDDAIAAVVLCVMNTKTDSSVGITFSRV